MPPDSKRTTEIEAFWRDAIEAVPGLDPNAAFTVFSFGDNPDLSAHVLAETLAGRNRATASLWWRYEATLPKAGDVAIATDWTGRPRAVLVWIRHHENIRRLHKGEEPKIGKTKPAPST